MPPKPVGDAGLPFFRPPSAPQVMSYPPLPSPPQPHPSAFAASSPARLPLHLLNQVAERRSAEML
mgnify:CR=1 FL=1